MDTTLLYTSRSSSYEKARPGYPEALIDYIFRELQSPEATTIADIGSGTGKFTQLLLKRGSRVYAIEPNEEMRLIAEKKLQDYPRFISLDGSASNSKIEEKVDAITVAQAFHWFDSVTFGNECRRILKPDGRVYLIWNLRVPDAAITNACRDVFQIYCPRFVDFNIGVKEDDPSIYKFFDGKCEKVIFNNPIKYDVDTFVERYLSSSYSLREEDDKYYECVQSVRDVFDKFSGKGEVVVPNRTICYSGMLSH